MQIINVNDDKYVVRGTVSVGKVINVPPNDLKKRYSLADTVLRNGDMLYICMKVIDAEFEDIN